MRATLAFFLVMVLSSIIFALSLSTDKISYTKGETITISGTGASGSVGITLANGPREILRESVKSTGNFSFAYQTKPLDPKGSWVVSVSSGGEVKSNTISIIPTREGAFYRVSFTSPPSEGTEYARTEDVPVSISVFDSGKPVSGAKVRAFADQSEFVLAETSPGIYQGGYAIPFDSKAGATEIYAVVEKKAGGGSFGGENSLKIEIKEVPLQIEFISPSIGVYKVGETIPVQIRVLYSTGDSVKNLLITAKANEYPFSLSQTEPDTYSGQYKTRENDTGVLSFSIQAMDPIGNIGTAYRNVEVRGIAVQAVTDYYWYLVVGALLLVAVLVFFARAFLSRSSLEKLERERDDILAMEKGLQEDYIKNGTIDRETFQKRMAAYETRLTELDEKIKRKKGKK